MTSNWQPEVKCPLIISKATHHSIQLTGSDVSCQGSPFLYLDFLGIHHQNQASGEQWKNLRGCAHELESHQDYQDQLVQSL